MKIIILIINYLNKCVKKEHQIGYSIHKAKNIIIFAKGLKQHHHQYTHSHAAAAAATTATATAASSYVFKMIKKYYKDLIKKYQK